jgi:membrane fusion protein (multidrug efflux system)
MPSTVARLAAAAAVAVGVAACGEPQKPPPPAQPPAVEVIVRTLQPQTVTLTQELPGRTSPYLVAEVRPQVGGIVKQRLFTEGSRVKAGQPLYQLDDAVLRADVASAQAVLQKAQASLNANRLTAARTAELAKIDAVSKQDDENAIAALRQSEAEVATAKAAIARNDVLLGYARITAPITGRIGKSSVTQGALVTANQAEPLATIQQLDPIYVDVTQSSAQLLELRKQVSAGRVEPARNLPVTILLEDGSRYSHQGKLTFADVSVDPATGSFLLRIIVPNPDELLLPGMYVRAVVGSAVAQQALLVPQRGVTRDAKGSTSVMLVGADGKVEQRAISVTRTIGDQWLVADGLRAGDRVVVEGLQKIRPGVQVTAVEAPASGTTPAGAGSAPPPNAKPAAK